MLCDAAGGDKSPNLLLYIPGAFSRFLTENLHYHSCVNSVPISGVLSCLKRDIISPLFYRILLHYLHFVLKDKLPNFSML